MKTTIGEFTCLLEATKVLPIDLLSADKENLRKGVTKVYNVVVSNGIAHCGGYILVRYEGKLNPSYDDRGNNQWWVYYPSGRMWSGFGKTREAALVGALKDAWRYA